ncbi:MAG: hypothetical protein AAGD09_22500 [Cyanobacteria bacterium P01_F01_bin.56]
MPDRDNGFTFTPSGRKIEGIPEGASVELNGKAGFTNDEGFGGPHLAAFAWYSGTVGFDIEQINLDGRISRQYPTQTTSQEIFDRLGEGGLFTGANDGAGNSLGTAKQGLQQGSGRGGFTQCWAAAKTNVPAHRPSQPQLRKIIPMMKLTQVISPSQPSSMATLMLG